MCTTIPTAPPPRGFFIWRSVIWRIIGTDKVTMKVVEITVADNPAERRMILREERRNYDDLRAVPLRMPMFGHTARASA
jgi:hypothetical protein